MLDKGWGGGGMAVECGGENWVEGGGGAFEPISQTLPPPSTIGSRVCLLTMPGGGSERAPGGRSVGTPTYMPQYDPHDGRIVLNVH